MVILGLNKTTLLDYPEHVAATVFTGGCDFACPFCHNRDLVYVENGIKENFVRRYSEEEILAFLKKRKGILTGVCITGGEPSLQTGLEEFINKIKELGYRVKLDTNGYHPEVLEHLVNKQLLDYVAMDIKNSRINYAGTSCIDNFDISRIQASIDCLMGNSTNLSFEFRTTVVKEYHTEKDMEDIASWISGAPHYFLQSFIDSGRTILSGLHAHDTDTLKKFLKICQNKIPNARLRGVDI